MVLIKTKTIRRAVSRVFGVAREVKNSITPKNARTVSAKVTKKVIVVKQKVSNVSKKELSHAHAQVKKELGKAKVHLKNAEKKIVSVVKSNPKKAVSFAVRIAKAIGVGVLEGLKEPSSVRSKRPTKKRRSSRLKNKKKR